MATNAEHQRAYRQRAAAALRNAKAAKQLDQPAPSLIVAWEAASPRQRADLLLRVSEQLPELPDATMIRTHADTVEGKIEDLLEWRTRLNTQIVKLNEYADKLDHEVAEIEVAIATLDSLVPADQ